MNDTEVLEEVEVEITTEKKKSKTLILHNDEHTPFDLVITCVMAICDFDRTQAEQVTMIAHYKGKCPLVEGEEEMLQEKLKMFASRGITTTID